MLLGGGVDLSKLHYVFQYVESCQTCIWFVDQNLICRFQPYYDLYMVGLGFFCKQFSAVDFLGTSTVIHTATSMDLIGSIRICTGYWLWKNNITRYADGGWCSTFAVNGLTFLPFVFVYLWYHVELVFNSPDYLYLYLSPITSLNAWKSQCLLFKLWPLPCQALDLIEATQSISIIGTSSIFWSSSHVE